MFYFFLFYVSGILTCLLAGYLYKKYLYKKFHEPQKQYGLYYLKPSFLSDSTPKSEILYEVKRDLGVAIEINPISIDGKMIKYDWERKDIPVIISKEEISRQIDVQLDQEFKELEFFDI